VNISNRLQVRYSHESPDDTITLPGTENAGDSKGSFRIRRAKFKIDGWFYKKELTYELQMNWPALTGSNVGAFLEDANIDWDISKKKAFRIKFGQFKYPQGRQELTSSGNQEFVDRSLVENRYGLGRDTGLQLWGTVLSDKLEWRVGAFNGNGLTRTLNDNAKFLLAARLQIQPNGDPKYSEADFDSKDKVLWAVAAFYNKNDLRFVSTANELDLDTWGFDAVVKKSGVFLTGAYYNREAKPETGGELKDKGWYGQGGYLFGGQHWEVAFRYGEFDPSGLVSSDKQTETGGVLSYYYNKHNLKLQGDFRQVKVESSAGDRKNNEFRIQTQFIF
jgi:phosphate-selective porin